MGFPRGCPFKMRWYDIFVVFTAHHCHWTSLGNARSLVEVDQVFIIIFLARESLAKGPWVNSAVNQTHCKTASTELRPGLDPPWSFIISVLHTKDQAYCITATPLSFALVGVPSLIIYHQFCMLKTNRSVIPPPLGFTLVADSEHHLSHQFYMQKTSEGEYH